MKKRSEFCNFEETKEMGATILKIKLPTESEIKKPLTPLQKKLLEGPTMTAGQIKQYEKKYPWLKNCKD